MNASFQQRLNDLEARFMNLENKLGDTPEKEAISILHAMLQEYMRSGGISGSSESKDPKDGKSFEEIANLYKHAPAMSGDAENSGLPVGTKAPEFSLPGSDGKNISLVDYQGKNVILAFYPLDWSPACSDQLSLYQSELAEFERANAQLLCISVDSIYSHGAWAEVRGLTFPLLADFNPKGDVAHRYGIWRETNGFSERALYVIDTEGIIRYKFISQKLDHIPDIYELMEQLKQMQKNPFEESKARK
jgi:peroxiredoxin